MAEPPPNPWPQDPEPPPGPVPDPDPQPAAPGCLDVLHAYQRLAQVYRERVLVDVDPRDRVVASINAEIAALVVYRDILSPQ